MKREHAILMLIVALSIALRVFLAFSVPNLESPAYFAVRQAEHILSEGTPFFYDHLSYGGRSLVFNPLPYYILAGAAALFGKMIGMKLMPNLFAGLLPVLLYFLAHYLVKDRRIALLTAFIGSVLPVFIAHTLQNASIYTLVIPLSIYASYLLIRSMSSTAHRAPFLIIAILLVLLHPSSWIWLLGFAIFFIICWVERITISSWLKEAFLSLFFLDLVWTILLFRPAFQRHGVQVLWQNTPLAVRTLSFVQFDFFSAVSLIGVVPFLAAFYVIYREMHTDREPKILFLIGQVASPFILLWLTFLPFTTGLLLFAVALVTLFPVFFANLLQYLRITKFARWVSFVWVLMICAVLLTAFLPAVLFATQVQTASEDLGAIADHALLYTPQDATIITLPEDAQFIMASTGRKTFVDTHFLMAPRAAVRIEDIHRIYRSSFSNNVLEILDDYDLNNTYIYHETGRYPGNMTFTQDTECFHLSLRTRAGSLYEVRCRLVEQ